LSADLSTPLVDLSGKWKVLFQPGTPNEEMLVGVFEQKMGNWVYGSFLSETGDYRYLHGYVADGGLALTDRTLVTRAFVVEAELKGSRRNDRCIVQRRKIKLPFKAIKDETVQLRDEAELTYLIKRDERVVLNNLIKLNGRKTNLDLSKNGQLTLIQIMGTWCPNCIDEANLLKELHATYGKQAWRLIALGFRGRDRHQKTKEPR